MSCLAAACAPGASAAARRCRPVLSGPLWWYDPALSKQWGESGWRDELDQHSKIGFNLLWLCNSPAGFGSEEDTRALRSLRDLCAKRKVRVILDTGSSPVWYAKLDLKKELDICGANIKRIGEEFAKHPAFFAWYVPHRFASGDLRGIGLPDLFAATSQWEIFRNALLSPRLVRTAADAKRLEDGRNVVLSGQIVSRVWTGLPWVCYVQAPDRASGIRVQGTGTAPTAGKMVTVSGLMDSFGPERMISATEVIPTGSPGEPRPLGLIERALGGGDFEYDPGPPVTGQIGVQGGCGTNNIGLLVRIAGTVTHSESKT